MPLLSLEPSPTTVHDIERVSLLHLQPVCFWGLHPACSEHHRVTKLASLGFHFPGHGDWVRDGQVCCVRQPLVRQPHGSLGRGVCQPELWEAMLGLGKGQQVRVMLLP